MPVVGRSPMDRAGELQAFDDGGGAEVEGARVRRGRICIARSLGADLDRDRLGHADCMRDLWISARCASRAWTTCRAKNRQT